MCIVGFYDFSEIELIGKFEWFWRFICSKLVINLGGMYIYVVLLLLVYVEENLISFSIMSYIISGCKFFIYFVKKLLWDM